MRELKAEKKVKHLKQSEQKAVASCTEYVTTRVLNDSCSRIVFMGNGESEVSLFLFNSFCLSVDLFARRGLTHFVELYFRVCNKNFPFCIGSSNVVASLFCWCTPCSIEESIPFFPQLVREISNNIFSHSKSFKK